MTVGEMVPLPARIARIVPETADTRTFVIVPDRPSPVLDASRPGQFVMLSVFGHGEAAFTLSALPENGSRGTVVLTVRRVGRLTGALFDLEVGARVGVRGPFGRGFPEDHGRAAIYVAGGCGLSPLKAAIARHLAMRPAGTPVAIVYGVRDPESRIHRDDIAEWSRLPDVHLIECAEHAGAEWPGRIGFVTDCLADAVARAAPRWAAVCGPPVMLPVVGRRLCNLGLDAADVHVAIERTMKCGTGHCGHCYVNDRYVCTDGPVFSFAELLGLPDAFGAAAVGVATC
jgi:NAD(P)H-flavin reductase